MSILNCGSGVHTVAARSVSLDPGQSTEVTFTVQSYVARGTHYVCEGKGLLFMFKTMQSINSSIV